MPSRTSATATSRMRGDIVRGCAGSCRTARCPNRCYSCRRTAAGMLNRSYTSEEIDAVAAYCDELERCDLIPIDRVDGLTTIRLRLGPAKDNQARRIN